MNERIKELAEQAGIKLTPCIIDGEEYDFDNVEMDTSDELEKFAELIVRECVIRAEREWIRNGSDTEHNQAVSQVIESIKKHFGVEECSG